VDEERVAGVEKMPGHVPTHHAGADEADGRLFRDLRNEAAHAEAYRAA
jgi:hypothetical protein